MTSKLTKKERASRAGIAAILALLFAGSAMAVLASALGVAVSAPALYLAALLAALLCVAGATSGAGAVAASLGFVLLAGIYAASHASGLGAIRELFADHADEARVALGARTLLTCGAFVSGALFFALLNHREFVPMAIMLLLAVLVSCHAMSARASLGAAVPGLAAAAAAFALTGGLQRDFSALRALAPAALAVVLALALIPAGRVTWEPLERAAEQVRGVFEQYFRFTRERVAFSINQEGYDHAGEVGDTVVSMLGGPAQPHTDPVLSVQTDAEVLLRGAIRTAYTGWSWVDAAPKNRYLYYDLTHLAARERVFTPPAALRDALLETDVSVELLREGTSTLFVPGLLDRFSMDLSTAVYYNTAGEMFLSRDVRPGDRYSLRALLPVMGDALRQAAIEGESARDDRYQDVLEDHLQLPDGIEGGVYALTMRVIDGADTAWDRAMAIMDYLRTNMRYTLEPEYPPQGRDFVSHFLLDTQRGYCSYYATAMAVMGRIAGLPTRYVEGFLARPGQEVLTGENAHAWAEVYFRGLGWIPFDATGGTVGRGWQAPDGGDAGSGGGDAEEGATPPLGDDGDYAGPQSTPTPSPEPDVGLGGDAPTPSPAPGDAPDDPAPMADPTPQPQSDASESDAPRDHAWVWWMLLALLLAALGALAVRWVRDRLKKSDPAAICGEAKTARQAALALYRANLTLLSHLGQVPAGGETPEAFAQRVSGQLKNPEYLDFVRAVTASSYGNRPLRREDAQLGLRAYERFRACLGRRERLRFTLTRVFRGLGDFEAIP